MIRTIFMLALSVEVWLALMLACRAKEFPVSDDDQKNIALICELAAKSPAVSIEMTANIAPWCVAWKARMVAPAPEEKKPEDKK